MPVKTGAALYLRVSTLDPHAETQLDLRQMAVQRGYNIFHKFTDWISYAKATWPGLD